MGAAHLFVAIGVHLGHERIRCSGQHRVAILLQVPVHGEARRGEAVRGGAADWVAGDGAHPVGLARDRARPLEPPIVLTVFETYDLNSASSMNLRQSSRA